MAIDTVRVQINGVWHTLAFNAGTGKYEATVAAPNITSYNVNAGHYYPVTIEAKDLASNTTTANDTHATLGNSLRLTVKEQTKPTIAFTAPAAGAYLTSNTPTISFQLRDESNGSGVKISTLQIQIDTGAILTNTSSGVTVTTVSGGYDVTYIPQSALSDGAHSVKVNVQDNDGNAANQAIRSFTVDTVAPTLNITNPASETTYKNVSSLTVTGNTNDATSSPVTVTIKLNGTDQGTVTVDGSGNFSKAITLASGSNSIEVKATDGAGKATTVTRTVILDTVAPVVNSITITPNPVNTGQSYTISVEVSD